MSEKQNVYINTLIIDLPDHVGAPPILITRYALQQIMHIKIQHKKP